MQHNTQLNPELAKEVNVDLQPTKERIMDNFSYWASFLGGCVSIGTFSMGASLIGALTVTQAILAMAIGCIVIAIGLVLIGNGGHKYGIPFPVQLRSSFGTTGVKIPGILRGVPAIVWFGFQSWVGAGAINMCLKLLFGFDNLPVVYVAFTALQVALSINGFKGIKWLENVSCVFLIGILAYMLYVVNTKFSVEIGDRFANIEGSWGMPFWAATTAFLGIYSTMILNASDYSRHVKEKTGPVATGVIYVLSILPVTLFMGLIGLLVTAATGNSDPIEVFATAMDNKFLTVITLLFIAFAQVTTNVLNNIVPPAYILMDSFKMKWSHATILVGVLSMCMMPWKLVTAESADGLSLFIKIYSAFLGPIFAVMVVDYYILRKRTLNVNDLYNKEGVFKGINWAAIIAIAIGSLCSLIVVDLSWYVSLIPSGLSYYILMKSLKSSESFHKGTILENQ
ncbi:Permease for cytosine/purines, uracil, thiamine, allantoin [Mannheimia varigena USDA-ARS-USMARC-1296]|uniref:Permease for cytosine/purines, uracil, thiamine, allantoin n=1 Tax=Mannheimia varigena USDA-ARS-USMARC-1296 TaxID=1433287 RepID=W0QC01_9PAST|nr:NCS1 family transporter [Mannheimia varigena]AHG75817.1 Permease for cytosine/purines, uracil, thiamine, allantoin [Mannheimia varigena USDA-ARS-USMARC-1296]